MQENQPKLNQETVVEQQKENLEKSKVDFEVKKEEVVKDLQKEDTKKFENNLNQFISTFQGQSKVMFDALYERQQNGLTPIQKREEFTGMDMHMKAIKNFEGKLDAQAIEKINENINKLSQLFNNIKLQPIAGPIRENPQNLDKLAIGAKIFSSSVQESGRKLPVEMIDKEMEERSKELRTSLAKLSEQVQNLSIFASKLRENSR